MSDITNAGIVAFLFTAIRLSVPLSYAAMGGYCSERSGTVNIALEGFMLLAAFASAATASYTHSVALALAVGILAAMFLASIHAFLCINLRADQIVSGMAINFLAVGLTPVLCKAMFEMSGGTPSLVISDRIQPWFGVSPLLIGVVFLTVFLWFLHSHTSIGQYFRFAGENPEALATQGISVIKVRWLGVLMSGFFCGISGAYLSIDHSAGFSRNMTSGRGFIALGALIIGRWTPLGAVLASLAFGCAEAAQILLQGAILPNGNTVAIQWIQILPYALTLAVLAGVGLRKGKYQKWRPPKKLGQPYELVP